ncbi:MAG TPA: hypothetical protein VL282_19270, partial [Tepidisphaeraceae bacterium]|nr:hypothetical protein [Tepidisphaeraceae bacterium]
MADIDAAKPRRFKRILNLLVVWFAGGVLISVAIAWAIALSVSNIQPIQTLQAWGSEQDGHVSITVDRGFGSIRLTLTREFGEGWGPMRAAGPPDTPSMGDRTSAWASLTQDSQQEWLELRYANATIPNSLQVYETLAPGALRRATVFDANENEIDAWNGNDPAKPNATGVFVATIPLGAKMAISRVRIYLDSPKVSGWNEIDAVGLTGQDGALQWAKSV